MQGELHAETPCKASFALGSSNDPQEATLNKKDVEQKKKVRVSDLPDENVLRLVLMGTGPFAVPSFEARGGQVTNWMVITRPSRWSGVARGLRPHQFAIGRRHMNCR